MGWSAQEEARAASIIADGIKHKFTLERRMAAARCTVHELQTRDEFDTYDEWRVIWLEGGNPDAFLVATGVLGDCETQVGI